MQSGQRDKKEGASQAHDAVIISQIASSGAERGRMKVSHKEHRIGSPVFWVCILSRVRERADHIIPLLVTFENLNLVELFAGRDRCHGE